MYGCLWLTARPLICSIWPVKVIFRVPVAVSQTLMVRSCDPVTNHSFPGSNAIERTQPKCPLMTRYSFQGACQTGLGHLLGSLFMIAALGLYFSSVCCMLGSLYSMIPKPLWASSVFCTGKLSIIFATSDVEGATAVEPSVASADFGVVPSPLAASMRIVAGSSSTLSYSSLTLQDSLSFCASTAVAGLATAPFAWKRARVRLRELEAKVLRGVTVSIPVPPPSSAAAAAGFLPTAIARRRPRTQA
mmetsp:Transcript_1003/g.3548  ORF Transcript_1003/g.3548 Transcript_1003/m.3548 type:complete len:246 (+) Transcript_1003:821-1558(+)